MTIYSPINAFQRNPDGTLHKTVPIDNNNTYPPNERYVPQPIVPQRSYSHLSNAKSRVFTGEVTPIDPNYFCRNGETSLDPNNPYKEVKVPAIENLSPSSPEILNKILEKHPKFQKIFFEVGGEGLVVEVLLGIASFFYRDREYFNTFDLLCIAEGKLLMEDADASNLFAYKDPFYHPKKNFDYSNFYTRIYATEEEKSFVLNNIKGVINKTNHSLGPQFLDIYVQRNNKKMATVNNTEVGIAHGASTVSDLANFNSAREDAFSGAINCKVTYFNHCSFDITVIERSGLRQVVKTRNFNYRPVFIVKRTYTVSKEAFDDLTKFFNYFQEESLSFTMKIFKTQFFEMLKRTPHAQSVIIAIDSSIDANHFKLNNGSIYLVSEDLMLSDKPLLSAPEHPFNSRNFNTESFRNFTNDSGDVGINFELIDNNGLIGDRFIMLAKKVFKISPKKDNVRQDGLYFTTMERDPNNERKKKPIQTYFPLDDLEEKFGIYKTYEEAVAGGDIQSLRKETILDMEFSHKVELQKFKNISLDKERENNELKHQLQQVQLKADNDNQLRKERMAAIEQENKEKDALRDQVERDRKEMYAERERTRTEENAKLQLMNKYLEADLDRQRSMMKDFYEGKSYAMKNSQEIMKWIPAMVGTLLSIIGIVMIKTKTA